MNKIVIANWKMNLSLRQTLDLAKKIKKGVKKFRKKGVDVVVCPSYTALSEVGEAIRKSNVKLGSQDVFWEEKGPFTSGVSSLMLKEIGCKYVIVGHSERRRYWNEDDWMVHQKVKAAIKAGLIPIICVGEKFEERKDHKKDHVIIKQVSRALEGIKIKKTDKVIVAYEPVWVIGSGQAVKPEEAEYANKVIKTRLLDLYSKKLVNENFRIIYGGSVDSKNVKGFIQQETVQGFLVGGKSLEGEEFVKIVKAVVK